jgi:hypothetical protein
MITADPRDFTVNLRTREVRHKSGAIVTFFQYPSYTEWRMADSGSIHNPKLFGGSPRELLRTAKEAALAAGMTHRKP